MSQLVRYLTKTEVNPIDTLTGNTGGPVGPTAGNINIVGTGVISVAGNPGTSTLTISSAAITGITITGDSGGTLGPSTAFTFTGGATGLTFSGATTTETLTGTLVVAHGGTGDASFIAYAPICGGTTTTGVLQSASTGISNSGWVLTSTGTSSLPTFQALPSTAITINGDSGSVTGSTLTYNANSQAGGTVRFTGSGTTMSFGVSDSNASTFIGNTAGGSGYANSGSSNTAIGYGAGASLQGTSSNNAVVGRSSLATATNGQFNAAIGYGTLQLITSGSYNCAIGFAAGQNYTSSESSNIMINNAGTVSESHVLRIGAGTGTTAQQLNKAFISGINGIAIPSSSSIMAVSSSDQVTSSSTFKIDSSNRVTNTGQPAFYAKVSADINNVTGDGTVYNVIFDTDVQDNTSMYNHTTGVFTVPVTGFYMVSGTVGLKGLVSSTNTYAIMTILDNTSSIAISSNQLNPVASSFGTSSINNVGVYYLTATHAIIIQVQVTGGTKVVGVDANSSTFSAALLC